MVACSDEGEYDMNYLMVDVEADGPCPGIYSMIEVAVIDCDNPSKFFTAQFAPITGTSSKEALASIKRTREDILKYPAAFHGMRTFYDWVNEYENPMFISDNNGFDWQFVNYYMHKFCNRNPFGHSSTNLNSLYKGFVQSMKKNSKHLRKTRHDHTALNDAMGNVEAFQAIRSMGLNGVSKSKT